MSRRLNIGDQLGDYRIIGFLGQGGMGAVYHAVHNKIGRAAAIKVLAEPPGSTTFKERFFNEARVQSSLHHPNIATLYDFQESGNLLYIVMEFVDGETLEPMIRRRSFAVEDALKTFESISSAVEFIHKNGIVHRDIKPQNVKVRSDGVVKLLDFGIAKGAISQQLTRVGGIIGTPNYLAPEQLLGRNATAQTDIWALGVLLCEMLTGKCPFEGTTIEELYARITNGRFDEPTVHNPAVPREVGTIVRRCMTVDPKDRYQTVTELLEDVRASVARYEPKPPAKPAHGLAMPKFFGRQAMTGSSFESAAHVAETSRRTAFRKTLMAAVSLVILGVFGITAWLLSGATAAVPNANGQRNGYSSANQALPLAQTQPSVGAVAQSDTTAISDRVRVTVEVTEGAADVYRDGRLLGRTPLQIEGRENELVRLKLTKDGHEDLEDSVELTSRRSVVTLG
jgi:hypothetical protein